MPDQGSVTQWLDLLKGGDEDAARFLWERYFRRIVGLARLELCGSPPRAANEEDVAISAFDRLCKGVKAGCFPNLLDPASAQEQQCCSSRTK
jgi:hypothetical protein